jgi:hypothetical protein
MLKEKNTSKVISQVELLAFTNGLIKLAKFKDLIKVISQVDIYSSGKGKEKTYTLALAVQKENINYYIDYMYYNQKRVIKIGAILPQHIIYEKDYIVNNSSQLQNFTNNMLHFIDLAMLDKITR